MLQQVKVFKNLPLIYNCKSKREVKFTNKAYSAVSKELLFRGGYVFFCTFISSVSAWVYGKEILYLYLYPLLNLSQNIIFTSISEAFSTTLGLCIFLGLGSAVPFFLYGVCCFFLPSLFPEEKIQWYMLCFLSVLFYITGIWFCSLYVIPELCRWFLQFSVSTDFLSLSLQARISNYLSWSRKMYLFCVCFFEVPLLFWFALKYVQSASLFLTRNRLFAGIILLLLCACISPPDVYSQGFLFFFCIMGYECALWYTFLQETLNKSRQKSSKQSKTLTKHEL